MSKYTFDINKFYHLMNLNNKKFHPIEMVGNIMKSFNTPEEFSYYYMLESLKYYENEYNNDILKYYFEYTFLFLLKTYIKLTEPNSEHFITYDIKMENIINKITIDQDNNLP
tara:strand:- start:684 stop:1019 length:336 start_codon:yes stop_codon:yes gene_type:complete